MHAPRAATRNHLLRSLSPQDFSIIEPHLQLVSLQRRMFISRPDVPITRVYFPLDGVVSVVARSKDGGEIEIGLIGRDGMAPCSTLLGVDNYPHDIYVQIEGEALAMSAPVLDELMRANGSLRETLQRYFMAYLTQTTSTVISNSNHPIEQRLARWLLMCHDRLPGDEIEITHDFIGMMLSVRRASVTVSLHVLEGIGAIRSTRGRITVRDRELLVELAGEAYGQAEAEYRKLVGPFPAD